MKKININAGLVLGFSVALLLLVVIFSVGLSSMSVIQSQLRDIVENKNVKTQLVTSMRNAARERTLSLYRMALMDDPFSRDEEFLVFNGFALDFISARDKLFLMKLSPEEQKAMEEQSQRTIVAVQLQEKVIDLMYRDELDDAKKLLHQKTMAAQEHVFKVLNRLTQIQRDETKKAVDESTLEYNRVRSLMYTLGSTAFLIVLLVSIIVIRRTSLSEAILFRQKERVEVTLNSIGDGVITTDAYGNVEYVNQVASKLTGVTNEQAHGKELFDVLSLVNEEGYPPNENPVLKAIEEGKIIDNYEPMTLVRREGENYAVELTAAPIYDYDGSTVGAVLVFRNMTAIRDMANQMAYQATHDSLTRLINRDEFERRLVEAINNARANNSHHVLCYMDLDQFKIINDTCGHIAGDEMLKQLTVLLHRKVRKSDTLARLGGDEFGILFLECKLEKARQIIEVLRTAINEFRFVWGDKSFEVGASFGVVSINRESGGLTEIMSAADSACFVAKDLGRNRVQCYELDDKLLTQRRGEMQWLSRIRSALENNLFQLFYQKIVPLQENEDKYNLELLIRMIDESGNIIPPMAFIPAAERYDLMPAIDRWVIKSAFFQLKQYQSFNARSDYFWTINISGNSLSDMKFLEYVLEQSKIYNINNHCVCFEITETAAVSNLSDATALITSLRAEGFRFALDDFGSGLSSFNYLKNLPVDYLKIDGSFVSDMLDDPIDFAMVESINQIGHILKLKTIAEFVESPMALEKLRELGVDFAQGYCVHKPELLSFQSERANLV